MKHYYFIEYAPLDNSGIITELIKSNHIDNLQKCLELAEQIYQEGSQYVRVAKMIGNETICEYEY